MENEAWVMIPKLKENGTECVLDLRPIVLCKNCVKRNYDDCPVNGWLDQPDDWFCPEGEKREE